jgi:peptide/nickel transport system substrate-binding protein
MQQRSSKLKAAWRLGAGLAAGALALAACGNSHAGGPGTTGNTGTAAGHRTKGGTAYWAESPGVKPNWIFPFASLSYFSTANLQQFQYLMYRPLYSFGPHGSAAPVVAFPLSPANAPVFSDNDAKVTISLKGWKFHDGQVVDAQSVIFWLNMMKVEGPANWAGYAAGDNQFPGNIKSYEAASPAALTVTITLDSSYNPTWYLYNELSQITPMTEAWDVTSLSAKAGTGGCGTVIAGKQMNGAEPTVVAACTKVWTFDTDNGGRSPHAQMAADQATYASNPLWAAGADGPWILTAFNASGEATFSPNALYSGPQKPYLDKFVEVPYTQDGAEYSALAAGGAGAPDVGYLPAEDSPPKPAGAGPLVAGPNAAALGSSYKLVVTPTWSVNYFPENYDSTKGADGHAGMIFRQLYFRQALQELVDEPGMISAYLRGYGVPTYGPVPVYPPNQFASGDEIDPNGPYPFSQSNAVNLLTANGWKVVPGGASTCAKAGTAKGDCGAGIPAGTPLKFSMVYVSGSQTLSQIVDLEVSEWGKAGIDVTTTQDTFNGVLSIATPCLPTVTAACQRWDMADWGGGWLYAPDYLPTGEEIFATGAGSNSGNYNNATNNTLIVETNKSSSTTVFAKWENSLAEQLPVVWQPNAVPEVEIAESLAGVTPINALGNLEPEYWYFTSS